MSSIHVETTHVLKGHYSSIYAIISGGGDTFFSGSGDKYIVKWNLETGLHENFSVMLPAPVYSMAFSEGKNYLFAGNGIGQIHFINLDLRAEEKCLQLTKAIVFDLLLLEAQGILITGSSDGWIHAIELPTGTIMWARKISDAKIRQLRPLDQEGNFVVCCGDGNLCALDLKGKFLFAFKAHFDSCNTALVFSDANLIYTGGKDAHLNVFELSSQKLVERIPAHNFALYDLALHPDMELMASCSRDKTIKLWDPQKAKFLLRIENPMQGGHSHSVNRLYWSSYKNLLVSGGDDRILLVRKIETDAE
jgi:WD40 repeat protein